MPDLCNYAYLCHKNNNSWNIERETKEYLNSIVHKGWGPRIQFQHTTSISTPRWKIFSRFMGETYTVPFPLKNQKPFENWIFDSERKRYFFSKLHGKLWALKNLWNMEHGNIENCVISIRMVTKIWPPKSNVTLS